MSSDREIRVIVDAVVDGMVEELNRGEHAIEDLAHTNEEGSSKIARANEKIDGSISKFRGSADIVDGLSTALAGVGLTLPGPVDGVLNLTRGIADLADGFVTAVGPALEGLGPKLAAFKNATVLQTAATKAQAFQQKALNFVMNQNPILRVVAVVTLLVGAFILAYKKSETFRNIVQGAMRAVRAAVDGVWSGAKRLVGYLADIPGKLGGLASGLIGLLTLPLRAEFNGVAAAWNNTVGRLSFSIPGWVPGIGGKGFDVPDIPYLANGGTALAGRAHIVGERGPELFVPGMTGTVIPNDVLMGMGGGGAPEVHVYIGDRELTDMVKVEMRNRDRATKQAVMAGSRRTVTA